MKRNELEIKQQCNKKNLFLSRFNSGKIFLSKSELIAQLISLFEDSIYNIHDEGDVFEKDAFALWYAINYIKRGEEDEK